MTGTFLTGDAAALEAWEIHKAGGSMREIAAIMGCSLSSAHKRVHKGSALRGETFPAVEQLNGDDAALEIRVSGREARSGYKACRDAASEADVKLTNAQAWAIVGRSIGVPHAGLCEYRAWGLRA